MLKKIYIPTEEELFFMEEMNSDVYKYLITKVVEVILAKGEKLDDIKKIEDELLDIPEIAHAICYVYPEMLFTLEYARYDMNLCLKLLDKKKDRQIFNLDILSSFSESVQNGPVMINTIYMLDELLKINPEYRFQYKKSTLLDDIFNVNYERFSSVIVRVMDKLINIDPAYAVKLFMDKQIKFDYISYIDENKNSQFLNEKINEYFKRYDIPESISIPYKGKNIMSNQDEHIKKLIKYINRK